MMRAGELAKWATSMKRSAPLAVNKLIRSTTSSVLLASIACSVLTGPALAQPAPQPTIWLMGEIHDNPEVHAYRLRDVNKLLADGWRPAILMEQFDVDKQAQLTEAWQRCKEAQCVIDGAGGQGWDWALYKPLIQVALDRRLPLIAANLSRDQLRVVTKEGLRAVFDADTVKHYRLDEPFDKAWLDTQGYAIRVGHCNMLPEHMITPMARSQAARDVMFAKLIAQYAPQGVILIAGNGHVRKDVGVSHWLNPELQDRVVVAGYVESAEADPSWYDRVRVVSPHPRPDPCEAFKRSRTP